MINNKMNREQNMLAEEESIQNIMYREAKERMELLQVSIEDIDKFLVDNEITKIVVDHKNMRVCKQSLNDGEKEVIKQLEREREYLVYYIIEDEGIWPDGCRFPRYTVLYVDQYKDEYEDKKTCIQRYKIIPAYVINQEEPDCSEITEIGFQNVSGLIINIT